MMATRYFKFIIVHDTKDNTHDHYYLQYTGNEKELDTFLEAISRSTIDRRDGHFAWAQAYKRLISESAADEHSSLPGEEMFYKCTGVFTSPITREELDKCYTEAGYNDNDDDPDPEYLGLQLSYLVDKALWHKCVSQYFC